MGKAHFKGDKYNIMTTNIIELLNSMFKQARQHRLLALLNAIMEKMLECFNERHQKVEIFTSPLTMDCEKVLRKHLVEFGELKPTGINENEWTFRGGGYNVEIDMLLINCTCKNLTWISFHVHKR